jgi:large subunit ribosomal protein L29
MKTSEIKNLSLIELKKRLQEEEESLANLRFLHATSQLESPVKLRTVRRDIARLKTIINIREAAGQQPEAGRATA